MVLTAIPTAIHGRLGVFAGVHCRTDSLRVRISGHRPTAADASPVTYKQVLRTADTGWDETHGEEHILSIASRCVDCLGGRPFAISQSGAPRHPEPPRRRVERDIPTTASLRSFRGRRVRPIDPPTCPPMTIRDRREGQPRIDQPSMSRPPTTRARARAPLRLNVRWARP